MRGRKLVRRLDGCERLRGSQKGHPRGKHPEAGPGLGPGPLQRIVLGVHEALHVRRAQSTDADHREHETRAAPKVALSENQRRACEEAPSQGQSGYNLGPPLCSLRHLPAREQRLPCDEQR